MMKKWMNKLFGEKTQQRWTYCDRYGFYTTSMDANREAKRLNKAFRERKYMYPNERTWKATVTLLPNDMAEILIWQGSI